MEYLDIRKNYSKEDIKITVEALGNGEIVILPTDTVYGIAADAFNDEAIKKIYKLKNREFSNPCNILVSNINMIRSAVKEISKEEERIIKKFFPGALTIIFDKNKNISDVITANKKTVGIRIPDNKFLIEVINEFGRPIVATSLNLAGKESMVNLDNLSNDFKEKADLIVDEGNTKGGIASTIIKINSGKVEILREGPISKEELEECIKS